jgi:ABC transporter with metal-binding/Fe-S-binding domain ATP-binding protein
VFLETIVRRLVISSTSLRVIEMKVCVLFSGGKDSVYATHYAQQQGYEVACLLTMVSKNTESYMYHTLKIERVSDIARSMGLTLYEVETDGVKEDEVDDLMEVLEELKRKEGIVGVVSGALASDYQKTRIERVCEELGLASLSPLWHVNPKVYMSFLIEEGFDVRIVGTFADGLDKSWVGKRMDAAMIRKLSKMNIHPAGEGGEIETMVLNGPIYKEAVR